MVLTIGPSTIHTLATGSAVRYPFQRKGFYARGYHFAFYVRSSELCWQRSADGQTWDGEQTITPAGEAPVDGSEFSVWFEAPANFHIVYADEGGDSPLYYRKCSISIAGDIQTPTAWREAVALSAGISFRYPTICVDDTNGYPIIGYLEYNRAAPATSTPYAIASDDAAGGWNPITVKGGTGWPQLSATGDEYWVTIVVPYQGADVMALYTNPGDLIRYDVYDMGGAWVGEQTASAIGADATKWSATSQREGKVPSVDPRRVHVAYCDGDKRLQYISIDDGTPAVTGPVLIYNATVEMGPAITTRIFGGDVNHYRTLYVFWTPTEDQPVKDVVSYAKSIDDGASWTNETGGVAPQGWINETTGELAGGDFESAYFEEQHHASLPEGYIGLLYTTEGASPEFIRFGALKFADPDEELLGKANITHSVELLGKANITHSVELLGKTDITHSVELLGKFEAQATAELLGKFEAQATAELLGKADITHSVDLLGKFEAQAIADLLGKFEAQATADLLGKFEAQATAELLGKADITHSVELLGKFEAQAIQDLLGKFEVLQGSQDLLGKFEVLQGSQDLLGKFEAQAIQDLLGKFEAQAIQDLLGKFDVGQGSQDLLGKFESQAIQDLLGKFEAQAIADLFGKADITHSVELLGKFEAQATADLLGKFEAQAIQDLLGKFEVLQGSADLLGKFEAQAIADLFGRADITHSVDLLCRADITHSVDLLCTFRTSIPDTWIIQGVSVEAYLFLNIVV